MLRLLIGLIKGVIVGGAVGYGLLRLGFIDAGAVAYAACAAVGALVGVVCGRAPWRSETIWTPIVKAIVGGVVGLGLAFVGERFLPTWSFAVPSVGTVGSHGPPFLALAVGALYGMFVELDDGGAGKSDKGERAAPRSSGK